MNPESNLNIQFTRILDLFSQIDQVDDMIAMHRSYEAGEFMAKQYERQKLQFIKELEESCPTSMTNEEFLELCYEYPNLRIEQDKLGNIFLLPPSSGLTGNQESEINADLGLWNRKHKLGKIFSPSTMFILPDGEKRMPDAAWVSIEKHKILAGWERKKFAHIVPDFIIEVRSPSDNLDDLKAKISNVWMANGVRLAWLIDPVEQTAFIFKPGAEPTEIKGFDHRLSGEEVLPGFEFDLTILKE